MKSPERLKGQRGVGGRSYKHRRVLGENIGSVRRAEGLSVEQLASLCGLKAAYLEGVETGREDVTGDVLANIARALKITVHELTAGI